MAIVWTVIGIVAAVLTSFGFVPQVRKMWKRRSVGDVSIGTFGQFTAGVILWAIYGMSRGDPVIIGANIVSLATLVVGLTLYYRYRGKKAKGIIHSTVLSAQEMGIDPQLVARESAKGLVKAVAESGGDVAQAVQAVVEEAVSSTQAPVVQVETRELAAAVASGLEEAAAEIGGGVADIVRQVVSDTLGDVQIEEEPG